MKYIDADKLQSKVKELNITTKTYEEQAAFSTALLMVTELIDTLRKEQASFSTALSRATELIDTLGKERESVAERFAKIVRGNLIGIDEEVQQKFEQLYFEVTGNKMYGGYND